MTSGFEPVIVRLNRPDVPLVGVRPRSDASKNDGKRR